MAKTETLTKKTSGSRRALTPEARENQIVALAVNEAEKQIREGTASSQVITHFLKLGTAKEQLEREKLRHEIELLKAKKESIKAAKQEEKLYQEALNAMRIYSGNGNTNN